MSKITLNPNSIYSHSRENFIVSKDALYMFTRTVSSLNNSIYGIQPTHEQLISGITIDDLGTPDLSDNHSLCVDVYFLNDNVDALKFFASRPFVKCSSVKERDEIAKNPLAVYLTPVSSSVSAEMGRSLSRRSLMNALKAIDKWDETQAFLSVNGYLDDWNTATTLDEFEPMMVSAVVALQTELGLDDETIESILSASVADGSFVSDNDNYEWIFTFNENVGWDYIKEFTKGDLYLSSVPETSGKWELIGSTSVTDEKLSNLLGDVYDCIYALSAAVGDGISAEISAREEADAFLSGAIDDEVSTRTAEIARVENETSTAIATEKTERESNDSFLSGAIDTERGDRTAEVLRLENKIDNDIAVEQSERASADSDILSALSDEISRAKTEEHNLSTEIIDEATARSNKDSEIETRIDDEVSSINKKIDELSSSLSCMENLSVVNSFHAPGITATQNETHVNADEVVVQDVLTANSGYGVAAPNAGFTNLTANNVVLTGNGLSVNSTTTLINAAQLTAGDAYAYSLCADNLTANYATIPAFATDSLTATSANLTGNGLTVDQYSGTKINATEFAARDLSCQYITVDVPGSHNYGLTAGGGENLFVNATKIVAETGDIDYLSADTISAGSIGAAGVITNTFVSPGLTAAGGTASIHGHGVYDDSNGTYITADAIEVNERLQVFNQFNAYGADGRGINVDASKTNVQANYVSSETIFVLSAELSGNGLSVSKNDGTWIKTQHLTASTGSNDNYGLTVDNENYSSKTELIATGLSVGSRAAASKGSLYVDANNIYVDSGRIDLTANELVAYSGSITANALSAPGINASTGNLWIDAFSVKTKSLSTYGIEASESKTEIKATGLSAPGIETNNGRVEITGNYASFNYASIADGDIAVPGLTSNYGGIGTAISAAKFDAPGVHIEEAGSYGGGLSVTGIRFSDSSYLSSVNSLSNSIKDWALGNELSGALHNEVTASHEALNNALTAETLRATGEENLIKNDFTELHDSLSNYVVEIESSGEEDYSRYIFKQGGQEIGTIDIAKDQFITSAYFVGTVLYLDLNTGNTISTDLSGLADVYTGDSGEATRVSVYVNPESNVISAALLDAYLLTSDAETLSSALDNKINGCIDGAEVAAILANTISTETFNSYASGETIPGSISAVIEWNKAIHNALLQLGNL